MNIFLIIGIIIGVLILLFIIIFFLPQKVSVAGIPKGFTEKQVKVGQVSLNYVEGPLNGPPLLLIPGQMESWQGYKAVMPALAERFHVFSVDLRGHGKSTRTPGQYSYNICGKDLKLFMEQVIGEPAIISGLSSGGVLVVWLAANAPKQVKAVISEDPPMFSSMYPRIIQEKYLAYMFQLAMDTLGGKKGRDLEAYLAGMGTPQPDQDELLMIPEQVAKVLMAIYRINQKLKPGRPYDMPFLPFEMRVGTKFYMEYDVDFSRATLDGRLSRDFDPQDALKKVKCPMLLMQASWSRHETWGLLGAMDDKDVEKIKALVKDLHYVKIDSSHGIHMGHPDWYVQQVCEFVDSCVD